MIGSFVDRDSEAEQERVPLSPSHVYPRDWDGEWQHAWVTGLPALDICTDISKGIRKDK